jgi:2-octaprenyl-6-methoxyphenol hydroxylase
MRQKKTNNTDVIIVGGGHSGLSLAACLGTAGLNVVCLERGAAKTAQSKISDGRTLALSYRTMQLLQKAGVTEVIKRDACPILDIRVADQDSTRYLDFDHRQVGHDPFGWIIENRLFQAALEKRIRALKNVSVVSGAAIKDIDYGDLSATVILGDGCIFEAPLVIGADGRKSLSREKAGIAIYGWDYQQTAIVCTIKHSMPHKNVAVEHFQPGGPFATLPMTKQRSSIVWTEKTAAAETLMKMPVEEFTAMLQEKVEDYLGAIELIGARFSHPLQLQHAKTYCGQRLALVGDAAHGIHPIAGQGLNLGMGDIEVLTEELTKALHLGLDLGAPAILQRYEKRRKFDNGNMVLATDLLDRLFSTAAPPVQAARRFGLGMVQNMPRLRRFFMKTAMGAHAKTA